MNRYQVVEVSCPQLASGAKEPATLKEVQDAPTVWAPPLVPTFVVAYTGMEARDDACVYYKCSRTQVRLRLSPESEALPPGAMFIVFRGQELRAAPAQQASVANEPRAPIVPTVKLPESPTQLRSRVIELVSMPVSHNDGSLADALRALLDKYAPKAKKK